MAHLRVIAAAGLTLALCGCVGHRAAVGEGQRVAPPQAAADGAAQPKAEPELPPVQAARACLKSGEELEKGGFEAEAIGEYERARQLDPKLGHVAGRLGVLYGRNGNDVRAAAEFDKALKLTPNDPDLLNDLGYFHSRRGDWAAAEKALDQAVRVKPDHARAWSNLAVVYARSGRPDESRKAFARVLTPAQAEYNLGVILAGLGRSEDAKACFRTALQLDPALVPAQHALQKVEVPADRPPVAGVSGR